MRTNIKERLKLVVINDEKKLKKTKQGKKTIMEKIQVRKVTMKDDDNTLTITLTQEIGYHPFDMLDINDLDSEVDVNLEIFLTQRQKKITDPIE